VKDDTRDTSVSVPTDVVMKLIRPLFKHGYNVTCDNFFISLDLAVRLTKENAAWLALFAKIVENCPRLLRQSNSCMKLHFSKLPPRRRASL